MIYNEEKRMAILNGPIFRPSRSEFGPPVADSPVYVRIDNNIANTHFVSLKKEKKQIVVQKRRVTNRRLYFFTVSIAPQ